MYGNGFLPNEFKNRAYISTNEQEFALHRDDAIEYINWCIEKNIKVLGYDTWIPTEPGPTIYIRENADGDGPFCIEALKNIDLESIKREKGMYPVFNIWTDAQDEKL